MHGSLSQLEAESESSPTNPKCELRRIRAELLWRVSL